MKKFSKRELETLRNSGVVIFEVDYDSVVIAVPYEEFSATTDLDASMVDYEATEAMVERACAAMPSLGGFRAGWGGYHLSKNYNSQPHVMYAGDYNDVSSSHHW